MLSATNYDPSSLSNELFLFSFSVQLFRQHDRFGQITHGTAQPAAFASQVQISLFFGDAPPVLQYSLRSFDNLARFEAAFHFQSL